MPAKCCRVCKETKPSSEFYARPDRRGDSALSWACRTCICRMKQERYIRKRLVLPEGHKLCPFCKRVLPVESFETNVARHDGRQVYCLECWPKYIKGWRVRPAAKEAERAKTARHRRTPEGAKKLRARQFTQFAIEFGYLTRQPCEAEGCPVGPDGTEVHHTQYDKPLDGLRWFCPEHHLSVGHAGNFGRRPRRIATS